MLVRQTLDIAEAGIQGGLGTDSGFDWIRLLGCVLLYRGREAAVTSDR